MNDQKEPASEPRDYIVLMRGEVLSEGRPTLIELGPVKANGGNSAIRKAREQFSIDGREVRGFVAVPFRNWTEAEGGLETPEPKFRLQEKAYVAPGQRTIEIEDELEDEE